MNPEIRPYRVPSETIEEFGRLLNLYNVERKPVVAPWYPPEGYWRKKKEVVYELPEELFEI